MTPEAQALTVKWNEWLRTLSVGSTMRIETSNTSDRCMFTLYYGEYSAVMPEDMLEGYVTAVVDHRLHLTGRLIESPLAGFLRRPADALNWRRVQEASQGKVHGIPNLRGRLIATNGVLAVLETWSGARYEVHYDNFVKDKVEVASLQVVDAKPKATRKARSSALKQLKRTAEEIAASMVDF